MSVSDEIYRKLSTAFQPQALEVHDESEEHRGHGGWREGGETHFRVCMTANSLSTLSRVNRDRAVYKALADELAGPVHALTLEISV